MKLEQQDGSTLDTVFYVYIVDITAFLCKNMQETPDTLPPGAGE
jgi:hypothetical protein